jgi:transposase-like protein
MEFLIDPEVPQQLVAYARQIAETRQYPVLIGGLQPADDYAVDGRWMPGLRSKLEAEMQEFRLAQAEGKERIWWLSEAADCLYYAACLDATAQAAPSQNPHASYIQVLAYLHPYGIDQWEAEAAALGKYSCRARMPYNKPAESAKERARRDAYENEQIRRALEQAQWPGVPLVEIAKKYGIPDPTLYAAAARGDILARRAGKTVLINESDAETRRWLLKHRQTA